MRRPGRAPPQWATASAYISEPLTGKAVTGFIPDEIPPADWFNYTWNQLGQWTGYLTGPSQTVWASRAFPDASTGVARGDVDAGTPDDAECRYRYAVCGIDGTGPFVAVSRSGSAWITQRNLPATPGTPAGVYFSPGTSPLTGSGDWYLWTDTGLYRTPSDYAGTTNALRGDASWAALSLPASPGVVAGVAGYFNDLVATTSTKLLVRTVGVWSEVAGLTSRQAGRAIVWTGTALVELSSTGGNGIIYTATNPAGAWTLRPTLTGVGVGTTWQLATGDTGVVVAFKTGVDVPEVWLSDDHGATWSSVTTPASLKQLTALRWHDGVWSATSTVAPYAQTSGDLEHWLPVPIPVGESGNELRDVLYGNGAWLLVSRSGVLQGAPAIDPGSEGYTPGTESSIPGNAGWLRGRKISLTAPTDGQVYAYDAGSGTFVPTTPSTPTLPWSSAAAPAAVQTTDATVTTIATIATTTDRGHTLTITVSATLSDRSAMVSWIWLVTVTNAAGAVTIRDALQVGMSDPTATHVAAVAPVAFDVSGTSVRVRVTGVAATTVDWSATVTTLLGGS